MSVKDDKNNKDKKNNLPKWLDNLLPKVRPASLVSFNSKDDHKTVDKTMYINMELKLDGTIEIYADEVFSEKIILSYQEFLHILCEPC